MGCGEPRSEAFARIGCGVGAARSEALAQRLHACRVVHLGLAGVEVCLHRLGGSVDSALEVHQLALAALGRLALGALGLLTLAKGGQLTVRSWAISRLTTASARSLWPVSRSTPGASLLSGIEDGALCIDDVECAAHALLVAGVDEGADFKGLRILIASAFLTLLKEADCMARAEQGTPLPQQGFLLASVLRSSWFRQ